MANIELKPGDVLHILNKDGKMIYGSTYKNTLEVLVEDSMKPNEPEDGYGDEPELLDEVTYKLPEWLANEKGLNKKVTGTLEKESDKAILLKIGKGHQTESVWLPKSQIELYVIPKDQSKLDEVI